MAGPRARAAVATSAQLKISDDKTKIARVVPYDATAAPCVPCAAAARARSLAAAARARSLCGRSAGAAEASSDKVVLSIAGIPEGVPRRAGALTRIWRVGVVGAQAPGGRLCGTRSRRTRACCTWRRSPRARVRAAACGPGARRAGV